MIADLVYLSAKNSGFGIESDYAVVKDYCKKYELDTIEIYRIVKQIVSELAK